MSAPEPTPNASAAGEARAAAASSAPDPGRGRPGLRRALLVLRIVVPIAAFAYLLSIIPLSTVLASAARVPLGAMLEVVLAVLAAMAISTVRWRILFGACGLPARPRLRELFRIYWIGAFYSSYVPGGVSGDLVRGMATRHVVGQGGLTTSMAVVLLERTLGLAGLLILVASTFSLFPLRAIPNVMGWSALGTVAAVGAVLGIVQGARLAPYLPAPLARVAGSLPRVRSLPHFALALLLSVLSQLCGVAAGHALLSSLAPEASLTHSLVILPLINAAQFVPITVGGAGVREAGFVVLFGLVGISQADALATSLVLSALLYGMNAIGGVLHLVRPVTLAADPDPAQPAAPEAG